MAIACCIHPIRYAGAYYTHKQHKKACTDENTPLQTLITSTIQYISKPILIHDHTLAITHHEAQHLILLGIMLMPTYSIPFYSL